jgi:hypothetical protein
MRAHEFLKENADAGTTSAGSMATVAMPLGQVVTRKVRRVETKYANSYNNSIPLRTTKNAR